MDNGYLYGLYVLFSYKNVFLFGYQTVLITVIFTNYNYTFCGTNVFWLKRKSHEYNEYGVILKQVYSFHK